MKRADIALFAAVWWPVTPLPQLRVLAYWAMWIFAWDDELDEPTGAYADEWEAAQAFRKETLQFVRRKLGLLGSDAHEQQQQRPAVTANAIVKAFTFVGDQLRAAYSVGMFCWRVFCRWGCFERPPTRRLFGCGKMEC
jgi:hypothetical protein